MNSTAPVRIVEGQAASEHTLQALSAYFSELDHRIDGGFDPELTEVSGPEDVTPPHGDFFLMTDLVTGAVIACGAVRRIDDERVELRRIWVTPEHRGRGHARTLVRALENKVRSFGASTAVVSLNPEMTEGIAMFRNRGYEPVEPFHRDTTASVFLGRVL
ncbi:MULTISPECIES: GNAT family N-acetyltransferase [Kocuria]|uniref:GNAT family N-acetyltransferase n=1 Tax=Kocuria TaxID=57493 RepID=UPI0008A5427D|nr:MULTISPECIES: GNAT family N-acetyltransferase [Kocuria]MCT1545278.1 GNAT family N-acetyltransferase [Kocuria rhizophila]MCT1880350.1 GNAT family N-acetyltransferase [Kocuria rhizophila]MCT2172098.1 GNAT family N-acetyltransferase [Kocuria rhizophila]MDN3462531.1 GNAT family N-acetyltransferase [Kocuria sp. APC 4018]OFK05733.1 acetyltransferase [Kocuria sp. HMSC066H03]